MSGPMFFCHWWRCLGTKMCPHTIWDCPHMTSNQ